MAKNEDKRNEKEEPKKKGGCLRTVLMLALLLLAVLGICAYQTFEPQDLGDIDGRREDVSAVPAPGRDLGKVLESALKGGHSATLTEREINHYLINTLKFRQEGAFKDHLELKGVWVRLTDDQAEVIIEREFKGGRRHTVSMFIQVEQGETEEGGLKSSVSYQSADPPILGFFRWGGRLGRVKVFQGYLIMVMGGFDSLSLAYGDELALLRQMFKEMTRVVIKEGEIILTPPES